MGSTARHKCACQVWNTQAHQGTCLVQLQACMLCLYAFVACLGVICVSAALTSSLCKSACVCCWCVPWAGVFYGMGFWSSCLLRQGSRSVAATFQATSLTPLCLLQSNIDNTTNWALSDEEYKAITTIKHQLRLLDGCPWLHEVGPYRYSFCYLKLSRKIHDQTRAWAMLPGHSHHPLSSLKVFRGPSQTSQHHMFVLSATQGC